MIFLCNWLWWMKHLIGKIKENMFVMNHSEFPKINEKLSKFSNKSTFSIECCVWNQNQSNLNSQSEERKIPFKSQWELKEYSLKSISFRASHHLSVRKNYRRANPSAAFCTLQNFFWISRFLCILFPSLLSNLQQRRPQWTTQKGF